MSALEEKLIELGLRPNEAKLYMILLEQGKDTLMNIAKKAKMNHSMVFGYLQYLVKERLVSKVQDGRMNYYYVNNPRKGLRMLVRKDTERTFRKQKILDDYMEGFDLRYSALTNTSPEIKWLEGKDAFKSLHKEIQGTEYGTMYEFTNIDEAWKVTSQKERMRNQKESRVVKRYARTIYTSEKGPLFPPKWKRSKCYFVPKGEYNFPGEIGIFGDKVALISFTPNYRVGIIRDSSIAETMRNLLELAIKGAEQYAHLVPKKMLGRKKRSPVAPSVQPMQDVPLLPSNSNQL